nr:transposase [Noviherbaspirillum sp. Root189]
MPAELGNWHTTYTRFKRWGQSGIWQRVVETVNGGDPTQTQSCSATRL